MQKLTTLEALVTAATVAILGKIWVFGGFLEDAGPILMELVWVRLGRGVDSFSQEECFLGRFGCLWMEPRDGQLVKNKGKYSDGFFLGWLKRKPRNKGYYRIASIAGIIILKVQN